MRLIFGSTTSHILSDIGEASFHSLSQLPLSADAPFTVGSQAKVSVYICHPQQRGATSALVVEAFDPPADPLFDVPAVLRVRGRAQSSLPPPARPPLPPSVSPLQLSLGMKRVREERGGGRGSRIPLRATPSANCAPAEFSLHSFDLSTVLVAIRS